MKVFVVLDYYLPGWRAGGPPRTIANLVERASEEIDFWIFTRDHDFGDRAPYTDVERDKWNQVGNAHVFYCSAKRLSLRTLRELLEEVRPDIIYLNSFFSPLTRKCLLLRRA